MARYRFTAAALSGDHGDFTGLGDDDHSIYTLADGSRALTGNLSVDEGITIDGFDVGTARSRAQIFADILLFA